MPSSRASVVGCVVLFCGLCAPIHAAVLSRGDLRKTIRQRYEGKLLLLTVPSSFDVIHFDGKGNPTRPPAEEPWTTCGLLHATKIDVQDNQMVLDGPRVVVALDPEPPGTKLVPVTTDRQVHVSIELPRSIRNASELNEFLAHVLSVDGLQQKIATAWHANVDLSRELYDVNALPPDGRIGTLEGGRAVYAWERGAVSKPRAVYKPGPSYPANALLKRVSGTIRVRVVVNERGFPEILEVVQHLREGLDARVLSAVSQWRFEPPLKDGVPAATMVVVEIKFHLRGKKA
jgi:TonB family protein